MRAKKERDVEFAESVFTDKRSADKVAKLLSARGIGRYLGWQSQREFRLDKAAEAMVLRAPEES